MPDWLGMLPIDCLLLMAKREDIIQIIDLSMGLKSETTMSNESLYRCIVVGL
jgi:hypothetical protein